MKKQLIIFGVGTLAELAHYYATYEMDFNVLSFVVDDDYLINDNLLNVPIIPLSTFINKYKNSNINIFVAIGYKSLINREIVFNKISNLGYILINIISKSSYIAKNITLGRNNFIMPGVIIESNVIIENNNVFWSNSTICHNTKIQDHNFIASNVTIGGEVKIGNRNFFGFSSTILQQKTIGSDILIGAQSLLTSDALESFRYMGTPAKKEKFIDPKTGVCVI